MNTIDGIWKEEQTTLTPSTTTTKMAASMLKLLRSSKFVTYRQLQAFRRTYLTDEYSCTTLWRDSIKEVYGSNVHAGNLAVDILERFDEDKDMSLVDVDRFACTVSQLKKSEEYLSKDVFTRFRHSNKSIPIQDHIIHALIRSYIDAKFYDELIEMMKNKFEYGIFPDDHAACILLNHLLLEKNYKAAAQVAYEVMLQEDYSHQLKVTLSIIAAVKHFSQTMTFDRYEPPEVDPDEEVEYQVVKIIRNPFYDDHFDIKDERHLMGKTLYYLAQNCSIVQPELTRSLQLIGLGLYEKFELANQLLESWVKDKSCEVVVFKDALRCYSEYLDDTPTRDPDTAERDMGEKTLDDEMIKLRLGPEQKTKCSAKFQELRSQVMGGNRVADVNIELTVEELGWSKKIQEYENADIQLLKDKYKTWMTRRKAEYEAQLHQDKKEEKIAEIRDKLETLQNRAELATYFDNLKDIKYYMKYKVKQEVVEEEEEEFVDAPGERTVAKKLKKK